MPNEEAPVGSGDVDGRTNRLIRAVAAEKDAQLQGVQAILKRITFIAAGVVFALCFWRYDFGLAPSLAAAVLTMPGRWPCLRQPPPRSFPPPTRPRARRFQCA